MKFERDPRDRRYRERLAGSFLASLVLHALLAALLFTVAVSSSQQGATENVSGAERVSFQRYSALAVSHAAAPAHGQPVPHVPTLAPLRHAPLTQPQTQRLPVNRHELAKIAPSAPPNPRPIPQQSAQPNLQPTQNIFEAQPRNEIPAAPVTVPTAAAISVALKVPASAAPSPQPIESARPAPKPAPSARPTAARLQTPAPAKPAVSPSAAAVARASPAATAAAASTRASPTAIGQASPAASAAPHAPGTARSPGPSPGPSSGASPGPRPGVGREVRPAPARPVAVPPTPAPVRRATPRPRATPGNLNAKLRSLLPNNPVHPTSKSYGPTYSLRGRLEPTPPPDVLAKTKYIYEVRNTGGDARVKMWVIQARKDGPTTICTGWLVRYPEAIRGGYADAGGPDSSIVHSNLHGGAANGTQVTIGGGSGGQPASPFAAGLAPIVDGIVTAPCSGRQLVPYVQSPEPSP